MNAFREEPEILVADTAKSLVAKMRNFAVIKSIGRDPIPDGAIPIGNGTYLDSTVTLRPQQVEIPP